MGGSKKVILAIIEVLLALAAVLSIWLTSLTPEVRESLLRMLLGM